MYSKFIVISQLAREILEEKKICTNLLKKVSALKDLLDIIYDCYPKILLLHDEDYKIFWRYSDSEFLEIEDYFSLLTEHLLKSDLNIYLVIRDVCDWDWRRRNGMVDELGALEVIRPKLPTEKFYTSDEKLWHQMIKEMRKGKFHPKVVSLVLVGSTAASSQNGQNWQK